VFGVVEYKRFGSVTSIIKGEQDGDWNKRWLWVNQILLVIAAKVHVSCLFGVSIWVKKSSQLQIHLFKGT